MRSRAIAVLLAIIPLVPLTGIGPAGASDEVRSDAPSMVAEAVRMEQLFVHLFNDRKFEELGAAYYTEDALVVPPNHEPIRGRAAIVEYFRGSRDAFGEVEVGEPLKSSASGTAVSMVGQYSAHSGQLRVTSHELYERQPDGSLRCTVDMFGFRDPLR
jgi:ketosteroid isomerase-like protein